jgi:RNA polymerase sigma-70 factor (ECF subfamily)
MFARLSEYVDGELPETLCEELARHLDGCTPCEAFLRTLKRTVDICRQLPPKPLPPALRDELRALIERERTR